MPPPGSAIVQPRTPPPELASAWFSDTGQQVGLEVKRSPLLADQGRACGTLPSSASIPSSLLLIPSRGVVLAEEISDRLAKNVGAGVFVVR